MMKASEFVTMAKRAATECKTLYVMGCFGAPMTSTNKKRYTTNNAYNKQASRTAMINAATSDTFGFDCVCFIKGILWGWNASINKQYGGAVYASNGVPDIGADAIMNYCTDVSSDFSKIEIGEIVHMSGHVGVYIGDGLAIECTPAWQNKVQITAVKNIGTKAGYNTRTWVNHGKLKFIEYDVSNVVEESKPDFFGGLGYFKLGDTHENVGKIAAFMRKTFPAYTKEAALGNYYGPNIESAVKIFQERAKAEGNYNSTIDGCFGPITLESLKKYGFKEN